MYGLYYNVLQASVMSDYNNIITECPTVQVDQKRYTYKFKYKYHNKHIIFIITNSTLMCYGK